MPATVTVHETWETVDPAQWDRLVGAHTPFAEHGWLSSLEASGSACAATGWRPRPVTVEVDGILCGGLPAWEVDHDRGQFVYQGHWTKAAEDAGLSLFPKILVGIPFTPVTGSRLFIHPSANAHATREALLTGLGRVSAGAKGVHILFSDVGERESWEQAGLFERRQYQYHWRNQGYANYDAFLARFRSRRRKDLKRERRETAHLEIQMHEAPDPAIIAEIWTAYNNTVERYGATDRFLTPAFFELLGQRFRHRLVAAVARDDGVFVGGALNVCKGERFYGRYWGQVQNHRFLHFELCYHQGIEYCIDRGLTAFEPGHGGDHKYHRGFEPVHTWSHHRLAHQGAHRSFKRSARAEAEWIDGRVAELLANSPLKPA